MALHETGQAVSAFWHKFRNTRRRDPSETAPAVATTIGRDPEPGRNLRAISRDVAAHQQASRRQVITAESLLDCYINALRRGDYAFRLLKDEFDEICTEAEIALVSDKRLAHWLRDRGHRKYRDGWPKVTMYKIAPVRRKAAA